MVFHDFIGPIGRALALYSRTMARDPEKGVSGRGLLKCMGRVQFADAQVMGRAGRLALAEMRRLSRDRVSFVKFSPALKDAFGILIDRLSAGSPKIVPCKSLD